MRLIMVDRKRNIQYNITKRKKLTSNNQNPVFFQKDAFKHSVLYL